MLLIGGAKKDRAKGPLAKLKYFDHDQGDQIWLFLKANVLTESAQIFGDFGGYWINIIFKLKLLWLLFGQLWGKLGYFLFQRMATLATTMTTSTRAKKVDPANKKLFALFFILSVTKYLECITIT